MQSEDAVAPSINPVASAMDADGKLVPGNGASIFTVTEAGGYYTFAVTQNGTTKYLSCSKNETVDGKISNAETLFFEETQSDYTLWRLEKCTGGYIMYNKVAKYGSNSVCIEYFSNAFSGWTFNGSTNLFAMKFVPVTDPYGLGFVLNPSVAITAGDANLGVDYTFSFVVDELTKLTDLKASYSVDGGAAKDVSTPSWATRSTRHHPERGACRQVLPDRHGQREERARHGIRQNRDGRDQRRADDRLRLSAAQCGDQGRQAAWRSLP